MQDIVLKWLRERYNIETPLTVSNAIYAGTDAVNIVIRPNYIKLAKRNESGSIWHPYTTISISDPDFYQKVAETIEALDHQQP
jgi:hypothetical protein